MAKRTRRRRRSWSRLLLLVVFVAAALYAGVLLSLPVPLRSPPKPPGPTKRRRSPPKTPPRTQKPRRPGGPTERKPYFYTILVSGVDDETAAATPISWWPWTRRTTTSTAPASPGTPRPSSTAKNHKINFAYNSGGTALLAETISQQLGIPVDFTVTVDLDGFAALVNAIGGVDFEVPISMNYDDPYQDLHIHFSAGMQHLTGAEA